MPGAAKKKLAGWTCGTRWVDYGHLHAAGDRFSPRSKSLKSKTPSTSTPVGFVARLADLADQRVLALLLLAYAAAAVWPSAGQAIRASTALPFPIPLMLLAVLLFVAGLGMDGGQIRAAYRWRVLVLAGQFFLWGGPLAIVLLLGQLAAAFPPGLLAGLGLVACMPIAASSVAWAQLSRGNIAISLGLLSTSTLLSPFIIYGVGRLELVAVGGGFDSTANATVIGLVSWIIPAVAAGGAVRWWAGSDRIATFRPHIKLISTVVLVILNYANASLALPGVLANPNWTILATAAAATASICSGGFLAGWLLARAASVEPPIRRAFVFGLGMKNTGMALVLGGIWFETQPLAIVAIILYTLAQHLIAACCHRQMQALCGKMPQPR